MKFKTSSAYTLIEVLVVVTIITLLFGVGYANYRNFGRRQELDGVAKIIQGDLRKAQQSALSGVKPDDPGCKTPHILTGYEFNVISENEYQIRANCSNGDVEIEEKTISENITITLAHNPIIFKVLGVGTNIEDSADIILTQEVTGNTITITINSGGDIQ